MNTDCSLLLETVLIGLSVFVSADRYTATLNCDDHWTLNSGMCFQFNDTQKDMTSAQESCKAQGGSLATVDKNSKHSFIINRIQDNQYWIGLTDQIQNNRYVWNSNGAQATFFKWCPGEPNDHDGGENCVEYLTKCWNDRKCTVAQKYICSKQPHINECGTSPCQHGGNCLDLINAYKCHCLDGYTGENCQTNINECQSNPCEHGGSCQDLVKGYICSCANGYSGTYCQIDVDECASNPCTNNGTCVDGIASLNCACMPGFTGITCEIDIDECNSSPCQHNATCVDLINEYRCICTNESMGDNCQLWLDHCVSAPCLHGGTCKNHFGGYTCDCQQTWHGDVCEYSETNRTEVCTDLEYTECSCLFRSIRKPDTRSYKVLSGLVGTFIGLIASILFLIVWMHQPHESIPKNKVINDEIAGCEVNEESISVTNEEEVVVTAGPMHCTCFVDHTGYDHFQRFDPKNNRFRFHSCRHKKPVSKQTRITSSKTSC